VTVTGEVVIVAGCVVEAAVCVVVVAADSGGRWSFRGSGGGRGGRGASERSRCRRGRQRGRRRCAWNEARIASCVSARRKHQTDTGQAVAAKQFGRSIDRSIAYFGRVCSGSGPRFTIGHRARVRLDGERASGVRHVIWSVWRAESHRSPHRRSSHKRNETDGPAGLEIHKRTRHPHCAVCRRDSS
jgi:hypothetical protein